MKDIERAGENLQYVRSVLDRADPRGSPAAIYWMWAAITLPGFAIIDLAPERAGLFWTFAGPLGGVASAWIGRRSARALGQEDLDEGMRHMLHWLGMMGAIFALIPLVSAGMLGERTLPSVILLLVALTYFTAGVHLDRKLLWVGLLTAGCYLATVRLQGKPWLWTFTGAVVAAALVASGILGRRTWRRAADPKTAV